MDEERILQILLDWNFWRIKLETGIRRTSYVKKILDFLETNFVITIVGS